MMHKIQMGKVIIKHSRPERCNSWSKIQGVKGLVNIILLEKELENL